MTTFIVIGHSQAVFTLWFLEDIIFCGERIIRKSLTINLNLSFGVKSSSTFASAPSQTKVTYDCYQAVSFIFFKICVTTTALTDVFFQDISMSTSVIVFFFSSIHFYPFLKTECINHNAGCGFIVGLKHVYLSGACDAILYQLEIIQSGYCYILHCFVTS